MKTSLIADVAREVDQLDLEPEGQSYASLTQDLRDIEAARQVATDRRNAVSEELRNFRSPRGIDVADALLRGVGASDAARGSSNRTALEEEREALSAGLTNLAIRERDTYTAIRSTEHRERAKVGPIFRPLLDNAMSEASAAISVIARHYAAARAIALATGGYGGREADALGDVLAVAVRDHSFLPFEQVDVPADVLGLLDQIRAKCSAHKGSAPPSVPNCPEVKFPAFLATAVQAARRAAG